MIHPIIANRRRLLAYLGAWLPAGLLLATLLRLASGAGWVPSLAVALPLALVHAFLCLAGWYPARAARPGVSSATRILAVNAAAALLSTALWLAIGRAWVLVLDSTSQFAGVAAGIDGHVLLFAAFGVLLYVTTAVLQYLLIALEDSREAERRALDLQVLARDAELKQLRAQIDPHFLFNALNTIAGMTHADPGTARSMCLLLADFLRQTLRVGSLPLIPLRDEIELAITFLAIEKARFGERLKIEQDIADETLDRLVPPLLLQPLVENAVRHGIAELLEGGRIGVSSRLDDGSLLVAVENPRDPGARPRRGGGLGLALVRRRLSAAFGPAAVLATAEKPDSFRAEVRIPDGAPRGH